MLKKFGPLQGSANHFDIEEVFHSATGLSTDEYLALCVAMISHYLDLNFEQIATMRNSIALTKEWFTKAQVNSISVDHFIENISALPGHEAFV